MKANKTKLQQETITVKDHPFVFSKGIITGISFLILAVYFFTFDKFFTQHSGKIGNDYSLFLPQLLDGVFWYKTNGLFEVAWFTPSFGGGLPNFPNPQSMYYSVPQFLCFVFDPVTSIRLTLLIFASLGFFGFYILLHKTFRLSPVTALLGSSLFLFNGFYAHRMLVGHLTFHSFMLFPFFIYAVLNETPFKTNFKKLLRDVCIGGSIIAYMIYTGALHILPPLILVTVISLLFYKFLNTPFKSGKAILKLLYILVFAFTLSAAKLNAEFSYLSLFPRDLYPLPGIPKFTDLVKLCFNALFGIVNEQQANNITANKLIYLEQHEYEFGLTVLPAIIIAAGLIFYFIKKRSEPQQTKISALQILYVIAIMLLLTIPLLLNYYTPEWNKFLKSLPFIKNSATNLRWFSAYIPLIVILTCVLIEKIKILSKYKTALVLVGIAIVLFSNLTRNRKNYANQIYDPKTIVQAYADVQSGKLQPEIKSIGVNGTLNDGMIVARNDLFVSGASQINPYEPIFGYRLETFPLGALHQGPVMEPDQNGNLNIKNPSSYVFPTENNCVPGTHFTIAQTESAERFRKYLSFPFLISPKQKTANYLTVFSLCVLVGIFIFLTYKHFSSKTEAGAIGNL